MCVQTAEECCAFETSTVNGNVNTTKSFPYFGKNAGTEEDWISIACRSRME